MIFLREKCLGKMSNPATIKNLERLLREYEEAKRFFDEAKTKTGKSNVSPQEITDGINNLYGLKHTGKKIKELCDGQNKAKKKEYNKTEYVHKSIPIKNDIKKEKKSDDKKSKKSNESDTDQSGSQNRGNTNY